MQKLTSPALLICVQAVDLDDPLMGFFVTWLEEAAKQFPHITVLALRIGRYHLPANVEVVSLRSASSSRIKVSWQLLKELWQRRSAYDAVFVRGDPHYLILAGWIWRLLRKSVVFWYAHYRRNGLAKLASFCAHRTVSSSRAASDGLFRVELIGQGIDTERFTMQARNKPSRWRGLVFGRMDLAKRVLQILEALKDLPRAAPFELTLRGTSGNVSYEMHIDALVAKDPRVVWDKRSVSYDQVPALYQNYDVILNATDGSLDKTLLEAALSGVVPLGTTSALEEWLPKDLFWLRAVNPGDFIATLIKLMELSDTQYQELIERVELVTREQHSVHAQVAALVRVFKRL